MSNHLFTLGNHTLSSGKKSRVIIDCNNLYKGDLEALAFMASTMVPAFRTVVGVPRGGLRFAQELLQYAQPEITGAPVLVAEDVVTSGASILRVMAEHPGSIGIAIFARGPLPDRVTAVLTLNTDTARI